MSDNSEDIPVNDNPFMGYSYTKVYSTNYTWKINQMTRIAEFCKESSNDINIYTNDPSDKLSINSPEFHTGADIADPWYLQLNMNKPSTSYSKSNNSLVRVREVISSSIHLICKSVKQVLLIRYKLFFLNDKNQQIENIAQSKLSTWRTEITNSEKCNKSLLIDFEELFNEKEKFLKNDTLTVGIELIVFDKYKSVNKSITSLRDSKPNTLTDDFKDLFLDNKNLEKDVVINVGDKKFKAHKFVLIMRSNFFEAMFTHNLEEKKNNEINLADVDPEIFEKVIEFIYTDKVDLDGCAEKLLEVSDKYDLQGLKRMCQEFIYKNITIENAFEVMVTSFLQENKQLKELAVEYVVNNYMELKNTQEFKDLKKSYPSMYVELLEKILEIETKGSEAEINYQSP